jgi:hypothetical protein
LHFLACLARQSPIFIARIWRCGLWALAFLFASYSFASGQEAGTAPAAGQDLRQGSAKLLRAVRESALAQAIADEQRANQTGSYTSVSFPLPTCTFEGGLCGALNRDGTIAVQPQFDWVDNFREGRARVRLGNLYGYVDTTGRLVVMPRYEIAGAYWRGLAEVDIDGKSALIDLEGRQVLEPKFVRAHPFTKDAFWVLEGTRRYLGRPGTAELANYEDWNITYDVSGEGKWGLVDRSGSWIRRPEFDSIRVFDRNDGSLVLVKGDTGWGVLKSDGTWLIEPKFESLGSVSHDGLIPAKVGEKFGYVNRFGIIVIESKFDNAGYFSEDGLATAGIGKSFGLIDRTGRWVIEPTYEWLVHGLKSYAGLVWFRSGREWGAIDLSGKMIVRPHFSQAGAIICDDGWVIGYHDRKRRAVRREDAAPLPSSDGDVFGQDCD